MKPFNEFYQTVRPAIEQLEGERKAAYTNTIQAMGIGLGVGLVGMLALGWFGGEVNPVALPFAGLFFAALGYGYAEWRYLGPYRKRFKSEVIERLVRFVSTDLHYDPSSGIGEAAYRQSRLFPRSYDRFSQEDLIAGQVGQTRLRVSEVHSEYRTTDSKGRTEWNTLFKGLFFVLDFPKRFHGSTFVLPDHTHWLGGLGDSLERLENRGGLVKLEDPEFERLFVVHSTDQVEARYLLSTRMMERIKALRKHGKLFLAFTADHLYVAIESSKNLFEPNILKPLGMDDMLQHMSNLRQVLGIVDELELNTRIWQR